MRIERVADIDTLRRGRELFDGPLQEAAAERFLDSAEHHLLFAYSDDGDPVGMVSGIETTHPDKGTEMFLYELGVADEAQRRGIATALVRALATLSRERGCHAIWVAVDPDDVAALATYRRAGLGDAAPCVTLTLDLAPLRHD